MAQKETTVKIIFRILLKSASSSRLLWPASSRLGGGSYGFSASTGSLGRPDFTAKKARRIKATTKERKNARLVEPPGSSERGEMGMARWRAHTRERGSERVSELLSERAVERFASSAVVLI